MYHVNGERNRINNYNYSDKESKYCFRTSKFMSFRTMIVARLKTRIVEHWYRYMEAEGYSRAMVAPVAFA